MIEINLIQVRKPLKLPIVMGIDLKDLNVKAIIIAMLVAYIPEHFITNDWKKELDSLDANEAEKRTKLTELSKQTDDEKKIKNMIEAFLKQEKVLETKLQVVKDIIKSKRNPMNIMLYLAKNIPTDVWLVGFEMEGNSITIKGESNSYKSIGLFIENLKNSVFFDTSLHLNNSTTKEKGEGLRTEYFEIKGNIARYE